MPSIRSQRSAAGKMLFKPSSCFSGCRIF